MRGSGPAALRPFFLAISRVKFKIYILTSLGFRLHISDCCTYQTGKLQRTIAQMRLLQHPFPSPGPSTITLPCFPYHYLDWSSPFLPRQHQSFSLLLVLLPCLCYPHLLMLVYSGNNILPGTIHRLSPRSFKMTFDRLRFVFLNGLYHSHRKAFS